MPVSGPPLREKIDADALLRAGLETGPDEPALVSAHSRWTWSELDAQSDRLAGNLLGLGLEPGDRVASLMPNRTVLLVHYLACLKAGLVAVPLNYRYMPPEIDHALEVSEATILLSHAQRDEDVAASILAGQLPLGNIRYGADQRSDTSYEQLIERPPAKTPTPPAPNAPAFIFFTSGSTGLPKGVTHTQETLGWLLAGVIAGMELSDKDVMLPASSFSHIGGVSFSLAALAAGCRVVSPRTFDGDELLPLFRQHRPTVVWMLPAALVCLVRDHDARPEDLSSVRLCLSGGDKVSAELEREFTELAGFPIDEGYGMTEIGCATLSPPAEVNRLGSIGRANAGYHLSVRDDAGNEVSAGEQGRLWVKSPANTVGYWNNSQATEKMVHDGWLDTGDVMRIDAEEYVWFCGRKKQIIVHDGSNICPQEVEEALLAHPAVACAGVVGVHDSLHGENVRAYITLRDTAAPPTSQELIRFARSRVGYKAPEQVIVLDEMPLNATGKVDRVTLKRMAAAHVQQNCTSGPEDPAD